MFESENNEFYDKIGSKIDVRQILTLDFLLVLLTHVLTKTKFFKRLQKMYVPDELIKAINDDIQHAGEALDQDMFKEFQSENFFRKTS